MKPTTILRRSRGHASGRIYTAIVSAIAAALILWWALAPVFGAVGNAFQLLAAALGAKP